MWHHITTESILQSHPLERLISQTSLHCLGIRRFIVLNNIQIALSGVTIFAEAMENLDEIDN
jgi:hypothetical protein